MFLALFKFFHKFWWVPMRITRVMSSQGIRGPPYSFIYGNTKEISNMIKRSTSVPMDVSHDIFPRIQPHYDSWLRIYGKNILYWQGPQPELVVTKPELLKQLMSVRELSTRRVQGVGPVFDKIFGGGLIFSQGEKWAKQRKIAAHAFNGDRLKNMVPTMVESVDTMLKRWKDAGTKERDVHEEFRTMTSEVIAKIVFGSSYEKGKQIFEMQGELFRLGAKQLSKTRLPGFGMIFKDKEDLETNKLLAGIQDIITKIIRNRDYTIVSEDEDNSTTDYLGILLNARHDANDNYKLAIQDIIDECRTFYIAGHGTISLLLTWATLLLGIHTEWQEKARKEVQEVFGNHNPSSEGIARLKKMSMIINETLRLYPPAISTGRKVYKETRVGDLVLPANLSLQIPFLPLHQDREIWGEDAHLFKPERFSEGVANAVNSNPGAFIPFGYGPRICVGNNFGINEAKITLSMILQRYRFTLSPNYVHAPVHYISLRPKSGVQIIFQAL
ncbi:putative cytochrome P450 [Helianthus annuus]|nr:putative cytochrome P450 [Helianthus annuus]